MRKYLIFFLILFAALFAIVFVFRKNGPHSFVFAWDINFALMLAVSSYTTTFNPKLTSAYYNPKKWEANGILYKWLGVNIFRKLLVLIGWEKVIRVASPVKKNLDAIKNLEHGTRQSEFNHLIIFFIVLAMNIFVVFRYGLTQSLSLFILNVIFNVYPVMLQRYNRPRLQRALRIREST